jgi:adenosylcobinamide-phosphate synthase
VPSLFAGAAAYLLWRVRDHIAVHFVLTVFLLKATFALRALGAAAYVVRDALAGGSLDGGRHALRSLCSRDPSALEPPALVAATIESVAENTSDSFVAPLFYYALFGIPGAVFYRAVNTLDAMVGYRGRFEYLGKASARLDDLLNLIPARITAMLLLVGAAIVRQDAAHGFRILRRDAPRTESPNAGRPMAAMAGLLRVELVKEGCYRLGDATRELTFSRIGDAWRVVCAAAFVASALVFALLETKYVLTH